MSFFAEKAKNLLNLQDESDDEFGGLESFDFNSDYDESSTSHEEKSEKVFQMANNQVSNDELDRDFAIPQKKRSLPQPVCEPPVPAKKSTVAMATTLPIKPVFSSVVPNEPRKFQIVMLDFKTSEKARPRPANSSSSQSSSRIAIPAPPLNPILFSAEPSSAIAQTSPVYASASASAPVPVPTSRTEEHLRLSDQPHKVARVSPMQLTSPAVTADNSLTDSASPPSRVAPFDSSSAFNSSVNILAECSQARSKVLVIQKGLDDMTAMYRDTIRGRLIRDREELALLATSLLEEDPIGVLVEGLSEMKMMISDVRNQLRSLEVVE